MFRTEERAFVPVAVSDLEVVVLAPVRVGEVKVSDVEDNCFSVRGHNPPLTPLTLLRLEMGWNGII